MKDRLIPQLNSMALLAMVAVILVGGLAWAGEGCEDHSKERSTASVSSDQQIFIDEGDDESASDGEAKGEAQFQDPTEVTSTAVRPSNEY